MSRVYPSYRYHKTEEPKIVHSEEDHAALGSGWATSPAEFEKSEEAASEETQEESEETPEVPSEEKSEEATEKPAGEQSTEEEKPRRRQRR